MGSDFGDHGLYRDESTLFDLNHHSIRSSHSLHQDRFLSSPTADFKLSNETFWGINDSNSRSEEGLRNTLSFQEMNSIDPILSNLTLSHPILTNVPPTSFDLEDRSSTPKPNVPLLQGSEDQRRPIEPIQDRSGDSRGQSDDLMGHFDSSRRVPIDSHLSRMTLDEVDRGRIWNEDLSQFGPRVSSIDESHQFHSPLFFEESQERRDEEDGGVEWFNDLDDGSDDRLDRNLLRNELRQEEEDEVEDQISLNDQTDYSRRILMVSNPDDET
ncbi:hypothetical protein DFH28DRAFT_8510 [Melampsora americana]|nr:hypothetical protein DFH28DRAFT_8510 [Melampsora americana]